MNDQMPNFTKDRFFILEELLFHAKCEYEAMVNANKLRELTSPSPAYGEEAFMDLAKRTRNGLKTYFDPITAG